MKIDKWGICLVLVFSANQLQLPSNKSSSRISNCFLKEDAISLILKTHLLFRMFASLDLEITI